jgi:excisionase family DNA binding protein
MVVMAGSREPSLFIADAAVLLGVSRRTVYYWIGEGRLTTVRTRGGSQRVLLSSIERLLRAQRGLPPLEGGRL